MTSFSELSGYSNTLPGYIPPSDSLDTLDPADLNVAADNTVIPVIYGRQRVQAKIATITKDGDNNLVVCCIWCLGEVESVENVLVDSKFTSTYPDSSVITVNYTGTSTQVVDPTLEALLPNYSDALVATNFGYNIGVCYSVVTVDKGSVEAFPTFEAIIQGRKVYDPRDGGQIEGTPSTWLYSTNPSLCIADFIKSKEYGWDKAVDYSSVTSCANFNDEIIPTTSIKRHEINISIDSVSATGTVVEALRAYAHCFVVFEGATVKLVKDDVIAYTPDEIDEDTILNLALKKNSIIDLPTVYRVEYTNISIEDVDPEGEWKVSEAIEYASGVEAGTTQRRESVISMYGYTDYNQALREAIQRINYYNLSNLYVTWRATDEALTYQVGDVVNITYPVGLTSRSFRITEIRPLEAGRWNIIGQEYSAAIYSDSNSTTGELPSYGLDHDFDTTPDIPTGLTHSQVTTVSSSGKVDITTTLIWDANTGNPVSTYTIGYKNITDGDTEYNYYDLSETQIVVPHSLEEKDLEAVVRANFGKRASDYTSVYAFTTVGDTVAPTKPLNFSVTDNRASVELTWDLPPEKDYSHVEIVYSPTNVFPAFTDLDLDMSLIHGTTNIAIISDVAPDTIGYFWARSVDTTGNKSDYVPLHTLAGEEGSTVLSTGGGDFEFTQPSTPTGFNVSQVTTVSDSGATVVTSTVFWNAVADPTSTYTVAYRNVTAGETEFTTYDTSETRLAIPAIEENITFEGKVRANYGDKSSPYTNLISFTTNEDSSAPTPPTGLTVSNGYDIVSISWDLPPEKDYVHTKIYTNTVTNSFNNANTFLGATAGGNTYTTPPLTPGLVGYFWAVSVDRTGNESAKYPATDASTVIGTTSGVDWDEIVDTGTKPEDNATVGAPEGTYVGSILAEDLLTDLDNLVIDYDSRNNHNFDPIAAPTIATNGTALDYVINPDSSATATFEWSWVGDELDIDGFAVFFRGDPDDTAPYVLGTNPSQEAVVQIPASKRAFVWQGIPASAYYTVGVTAYRKVNYDAVLAPDGVIVSTLVQPSLGAEDPYQPTAEVAFTGDFVGTLETDNVNRWSAMVDDNFKMPRDNADKTSDNEAAGLITGANIELTGSAKFEGTTSTAHGPVSIAANTSYTQINGIIGYSSNGSGVGVIGKNSGSGLGVDGFSTSGIGVWASSASGVALYATSTNTAFNCDGHMLKNGVDKVLNFNADMLDWYHASNASGNIPISNGTVNSTLNADYLDGYSSNEFVGANNCQSGIANSSGSNISMTMSTGLSDFETRGSGSTVYFQTKGSDSRLKEDIEDESLGLEFINNLKPVSFKYINDSTLVMHGLIAQDLQAIIGSPNKDSLLERRKHDGMLSVNYNALTTPHIKATQELTEIVKQQADIIASLEERITILESK